MNAVAEGRLQADSPRRCPLPPAGCEPNIARAAAMFLHDFRTGRLGPIMLDPIVLGEELVANEDVHYSQRALPI